MFIKVIKKKDPGSQKCYVYQRLMDLAIIVRGPRQRVALSLRKFERAWQGWKAIPDHITEILTEQQKVQNPALLMKSLTNDKRERIHIGQTTQPELYHQTVLKALCLRSMSLKSKRAVL